MMDHLTIKDAEYQGEANMNATELLNEAADLIERDGWRPDESSGVCVGNAIYQIWVADPAGVFFSEGIAAVNELIGGTNMSDLWRWNDTVCLDQTEAVNTIRKAAENVIGDRE